jgi:predicted nucleic acid-binding protein
MPGFVPDASATMPWRFEDEATPWTEALLDRIQGGEEVLVPAHWPLEVVNALLIARRRGRVTADQTAEFIKDLAALPIRLEPPSGPAQWPTIVALAEQHRLTACDAAYLELVQRIGLPLIGEAGAPDASSKVKPAQSISANPRSGFSSRWSHGASCKFCLTPR